MKENVQELLKSVKDLQKEKEKAVQAQAKSQASMMQLVEELKLKTNVISEVQKENLENEAKLKQQQNLYEAVRSEKNLYSKNLLEAQDDVAELNRKFKIAQH